MRYFHTDSHGIHYYVDGDMCPSTCRLAWAMAHVSGWLATSGEWLIKLAERLFSWALRIHPSVHWKL